MIAGTPWCIIVGELVIAVMLAALVIGVKRRGWLTTIVARIAGGAGIFVAYALAFWMADGWPRH